MKKDSSTKTPRRYKPNHIPKGERISSIIFSTALILYGTVGVITDDIYIPGRHSRRGLHFHGVPCIVFYISFLVAASNLISVVVDHYDTRNNEINYKRFAKVTKFLGWILFIGAALLDLFVYDQSTRY